MYNAADDFYGSDDLDDIPANTLAELEQKARVSTQQGARPGGQQRVDNGQRLKGQGPPQPVINVDADVDDAFADDGDDVIDLDDDQNYNKAPSRVLDEATEREQWRVQRYGQTTQGPRPQTTRPVRGNVVVMEEIDAPIVTNDTDSGQVARLKAQIAELELKSHGHQRAAEDAKAAALSKAGEIAIVRSNQHKEAKDFERRMKTLQQQYAEEMAKAKSELEAVKKDRERFETSNRFLEADLAHETERARQLRRPPKDGPNSRPTKSPLATPSKPRGMSLRDGFDDDEVTIVSPSKVRERKGPQTPRSSVKRKRELKDDSAPASPLSVSANLVNDSPTPAPKAAPAPPQTDERLSFIDQIFKHTAPDKEERVLEVLSRYHFPGQQTSLAAPLYDTMTISSQQNVDTVRIDFCNALLSLWSECLAQDYLEPLYDITELLQYILATNSAALSMALISQITPLCQKTTDLIALPTAKALKDPVQNPLPSRQLRKNIDPMRYLRLLHSIAANATPVLVKQAHQTLHLVNFWSHMEFDFILVVLHRAQPLALMKHMLSLLHTSVLKESFASIYPDHSRQKKMESDIVDRLTSLLFETPEQPRRPKKPPGMADYLRVKTAEELEDEKEPTPYSQKELLELRTAVLGLLSALALDDHGSALLAGHRVAIPRLVRFLHESILDMYETYQGPTLSEGSDGEAGGSGGSGGTQEPSDVDPDAAADNAPVARVWDGAHAAHAAHVNDTVTVVYYLALAYNAGGAANPPTLDLSAALAQHPAALQRYTTALARVAFAEPWAAEARVQPSVVDMAHELLDDAVSPGEGEGVVSVFGSGRPPGASASAEAAAASRDEASE